MRQTAQRSKIILRYLWVVCDAFDFDPPKSEGKKIIEK